jgi:hypothetical protein
MVEMEVAVHDHLDISGRHAGRGERLVQRAPHGVVEILDLLVALGDAGVQEHEPVRMADQVASEHDLLAGPRISVVGDREMAEQDPPDAVEGDHRTAL